MKNHLRSYLRVKGHKYHLYWWCKEKYIMPLTKKRVKELMSNQKWLDSIKQIESTNSITNIYVRLL